MTTPEIIKPTVGRKVWFRPNGIKALQEAGVLEYLPTPLIVNGGDQPLDATVVYVWNDRCVNLTILDHSGHPFIASSVPLLQDGDEKPASGFYCEWMPYQKGQATKSASTPLPVVDPGPDSLEREIQAKANKGPRVTPADIEAEIVSEHFFSAADGANGSHAISSQHFNGVPTSDVLVLLTFCVLVLRNGFTVTGESACASPENFNAEIGRHIARENAIAKVWPLLGFRLRDELAR